MQRTRLRPALSAVVVGPRVVRQRWELDGDAAPLTLALGGLLRRMWSMIEKERLVVPIYIDVNALLDLLASIEGGFSLVEKVTTRTAVTTTSDKSLTSEMGTEFGVPNVLSLLKVRLSGVLSSTKQSEANEQKEAERYHTYGSLLYRLRAFLDDRTLIKRPGESDDVWRSVKPSDFVEVRGVFRPNPLTDSLERVDRLVGIFEILAGSGLMSSSQPSGKSSRKGQKGQNDKKLMKQIRQFLKGILLDIERENIRTFVVETTEQNSFVTVALLFTNYLRDRSMTEINHKEYRLLGKVVRKIEKETDESIDLLRGTGLGGIGKETLDELWGAFNQLEGMNLPEIKSEILGPALEVVPIAIFV